MYFEPCIVEYIQTADMNNYSIFSLKPKQPRYQTYLDTKLTSYTYNVILAI